MAFTNETALRGHTSEDTAYVVDDYPYGFRLRTRIRYWIETNAKHGDRFVSQTLNPKTDKWNKPKRSTYCEIGCMFVENEPGDAFGHVKWAGMTYYSDATDLAAFLAAFGEEHLNADQRSRVAMLRAAYTVREHITVTIHDGPVTPEHDAEQAATKAAISRQWAREAARERAAMDTETDD